MVVCSCVLIVFLLHRESLKLIMDDEPLISEVVLSHQTSMKLTFLSPSIKASILYPP
jgi:hypothetical protein